MANSVLLRELKWAIKKATTWNADITGFTTGDQMLPQALSGFDDVRPNIPNKPAGLARVQASYQKPQDQPTPGFTIWPYEADNIWLLLLALYFGDDDVSGVSDPYTHTMEEQNLSDYFCTVKGQEGDEVKGVASYMQTQLEIQPNGEGIIEFVSSGIADFYDVFTATDLDTVTKTDIADPYEMENVAFRINDQDGAALAGGDKMELTNFKITMPRPAESIRASGNLYWSQPKQGEYPEPMVDIELESKTAAAKALYTDYINQTLKKLDFTFTGTSADREFIFEAPAAKIESALYEPATIINAKFTFRLQKATAAPTGMTGVNNTAIVKTSYATDVLA